MVRTNATTCGSNNISFCVYSSYKSSVSAATGGNYDSHYKASQQIAPASWQKEQFINLWYKYNYAELVW